MATLFISDLHLDPARPRIARLFSDFLDGEARGAQALYILGDLFEAWVGDDDPSDTGATVAAGLKRLAAGGVPVYFQRGNRDFLLGRDYAARAGITVLPDPAVILLDGSPVLLTHGDLLCTDDAAYQQFRTQTRDPAWQAQFLAQPLAARLAFAAQARAGGEVGVVDQADLGQPVEHRGCDVVGVAPLAELSLQLGAGACSRGEQAQAHAPRLLLAGELGGLRSQRGQAGLRRR